MFIKLKTGRDAGQIVEMKFEDAKAMLLDGRADPAYSDASEVTAPIAEEIPARVQKPAPKQPQSKKRK
jgi:hypothetical protein